MNGSNKIVSLRLLIVCFVKFAPIDQSRGLYKYIENRPFGEILNFISALGMSGNESVVHAFVCCGFPFFEYRTTSEQAQQSTTSSNSQPLCNQPSSSRPHDPAIETNPGNSGNYPVPMNYKTRKAISIILIVLWTRTLFLTTFYFVKNASTTILFLILVQELTYIDHEDLANFLSNIQQIVEDWNRLQHVLGTRPGVYSWIERRVVAGLSTITKAISYLLKDWNGETGLLESTVSLLCYGSEVPRGTALTEGLRRHGFVLAAGTKNGANIILKCVCLNYNI
jgi:hypothetical protein